MAVNKDKTDKSPDDQEKKIDVPEQSQNDNQEPSLKQGRIGGAVLITVYHHKRSGKIKKLRRNYGANFDEKSRYFVAKVYAENYIKRLAILQEEKVKAAGNVGGKRTKKRKLLNFLYFALNVIVIGIVLGVQLSQEDNPLESLSAIFTVDLRFIIVVAGLFVLCSFLDLIRYSTLIHKATGLFRIRLSYKVGALGHYYDVITPLSTGGQPFQIFYASKYGIKAGESVSIFMGKYIFYQIVYFLCITYILFRNLFTHSLGLIVGNVAEGVVASLSWIGYAICAVVIIVVTLVTLNRRVGTSFIVGILKFLNKIKIGKFKLIKDYNKLFVKAMRVVGDWQNTSKKYSKSFWVVFVNVLASLAFFIAWYSIPFFIYSAFNGWNPELWSTFITLAVMVDLASAFNPIPMGIGTADLSFSVLYAGFFAVSTRVWALLIWRFFTYYIHIIKGLIVLTYDVTAGDRKLAKYKDFWMLPYRQRLKIKREERLNKKLNDLAK